MSESKDALTEDLDTALAGIGPAHALVRRFRLEVLDGPEAGRVWTSDKDRSVFGNQEGADLVLSDRTISRFHCEIRLSPQAVVIRDLESRNGTLVDGVRVLSAHVEDGACLTLGRSRLRFSLGAEEARVPLAARTEFGALVGHSIAMRAVFAVLERAAASDVTVLVEGETGTGKEAIAEALHAEGARSRGPLVVVDCGAIPPTCSRASSLATSGAPSRAPRPSAAGRSSWPAAARSSSTRSASSRSSCSQSSCGRSRAARSSAWAAIVTSPSTFAWSRPRTAIYRPRSTGAASGPTSTTAWRCCRSACRRCASAPRTCRAWPSTSCAGWEAIPRACARARPWPSWGGTRGRATSASCATTWSAASRFDGPVPLPRTSRPVAAGLDTSVPLRQAREAFDRQYLEQTLSEHDGNVTAAARAAGMDRIHFYRLLWKHGLRQPGTR